MAVTDMRAPVGSLDYRRTLRGAGDLSKTPLYVAVYLLWRCGVAQESLEEAFGVTRRQIQWAIDQVRRDKNDGVLARRVA